jgi:hypothetical protein
MKASSFLGLAAIAISPVLALQATTTVCFPHIPNPYQKTILTERTALFRRSKRRLWLRPRIWQLNVQLAGAFPCSRPKLFPLTPPAGQYRLRHIHGSRLASPLRQRRALLVRFGLREMLPTDVDRELSMLDLRIRRGIWPVDYRDGHESLSE